MVCFVHAVCSAASAISADTASRALASISVGVGPGLLADAFGLVPRAGGGLRGLGTDAVGLGLGVAPQGGPFGVGPLGGGALLLVELDPGRGERLVVRRAGPCQLVLVLGDEFRRPLLDLRGTLAGRGDDGLGLLAQHLGRLPAVTGVAVGVVAGIGQQRVGGLLGPRDDELGLGQRVGDDRLRLGAAVLLGSGRAAGAGSGRAQLGQARRR